MDLGLISQVSHRHIRLPVWLWAAVAVFLAPAVFYGGSPTSAGVALAFATIAITIVHATVALGWREALVFLIVCLAVTFSVENLSIATGLPFGHYHFIVGAGLPHVGSIPVIVGFLYFGMGYPSWIVAGILLDRAGAQADDRFRLFALPVIASFIMVQWDVVIDPASSTLGGAWKWHDGGGYFGVPLSNYLGWYLNVWLFFQLFAAWQFARRDRRSGMTVDPTSRFWLIPILMLLGAGLAQIAPFITAGNAIVVDATGQHWREHDIRETALIVMIATMLFTSALAALRWSAGVRAANPQL